MLLSGYFWGTLFSNRQAAQKVRSQPDVLAACFSGLVREPGSFIFSSGSFHGKIGFAMMGQSISRMPSW